MVGAQTDREAEEFKGLTTGGALSEELTFKCTGVRVGGVFPFHCPEPVQKYVRGTRFQKAWGWSTDTPAALRFRKLRRAIFSPEHHFADPSLVLNTQFELTSLRLSSGREVRKLHGEAYMLLYAAETASLVWYVDCHVEEFTRRELIELVALARGTSERIDRTSKTHITATLHNAKHVFESLYELAEYLVSNGLESRLKRVREIGSESRFCYPLLYVGDVVGTSTATEIATRFARDISGILNLWIDDAEWLKQHELERSLQLDFHPFEYGLTLGSVSSTVEFHSGPAVRAISDRECLGIEAHHEQELIYLFNLCERPITNVSGLRYYEAILDQILKSGEGLPSSNPFSTFFLLGQAIRLSRLRRNLAIAVDNFRTSHFTRKSYMQVAFRRYRDEFGTQELLASVDKKIGDLESTITNTYSMIMAFLVLLLTVIGLGVAVVGIYISVVRP